MGNLNGWIRLWVLLSGLWILLLTIVFVPDRLRVESVSLFELVGEISQEVRRAISTDPNENGIRVKVEGLSVDIFLKPSTSETLVAQAKAEYEKLAKDSAHIIWRRNFFGMLTAILSFPIISYLLARALYWVWLGFKRPAE